MSLDIILYNASKMTREEGERISLDRTAIILAPEEWRRQWHILRVNEALKGRRGIIMC